MLKRSQGSAAPSVRIEAAEAMLKGREGSADPTGGADTCKRDL
jgi:hypothetical protein